MKDDQFVFVNGVRVDYFESKNDLLSIKDKKIYISIGGEAIYNANENMLNVANGENAICYADGELAVLALKKKGFRLAKKIPGCELWLEFLKVIGPRKTFIVGSKLDVIELVSKKVKANFQDELLYYRDGYLDENSIIDLENTLIKLKPSLVILALGQPKQEQLAQRLFDIHNADYLCVGGALDVYSGVVNRAPKIMIYFKLEWLYRLVIDPKRIKRQIGLLKVLWSINFNRSYIN
ncbi:TPA: WecB/TagA/CpsF family glycosyltransferase [Vibrio cholerae]|nr:glycosyltransferase [Vibrio cholerae]EKF9746180.1 WecB/TagA/CpsF family glycosyltransferase [Vibrio cholerae]